jgi:hypothetical protein
MPEVTRDIPSLPDERRVTHRIEIRMYNVGSRKYWVDLSGSLPTAATRKMGYGLEEDQIARPNQLAISIYGSTKPTCWIESIYAWVRCDYQVRIARSRHERFA